MSDNATLSLATCRLVTDSSADLWTMEHLPFASAPLTVRTTEREYVDDAALDVAAMVNELQAYKGKSSTACPSAGEYIKAFGDACYVFCLTITSKLSGSYNAAVNAKRLYEQEHPERRVFVMDTLTTGPEMRLLAERIEQGVLAGRTFDEVCADVSAYASHTGLLFILQSMKNLANNGRVNPLVAKALGLMGIRLIGRASDDGVLQVLTKPRGTRAVIEGIVEHMVTLGYTGGRVHIDHCQNEPDAQALRQRLLQAYPSAHIELHPCGALCSFYAEKQGLLVGFER